MEELPVVRMRYRMGISSRADDRELVEHALAGSEHAFTLLVERHQQAVFRVLLRMVGDPSLAEDLAQEAFVKAYRALATFDRRRKLSSWLFKIAHNTAIDHLRRHRPDMVPLETDEPDRLDLLGRLEDGVRSPEEEASRGDLRRALEEAFAALEPTYQEIMVLRFQEGLAYEEISEVTGLNLGTVKTRIHRGRKQMAEYLRDRGWSSGDI
jgi:RNA polymerase sigma-70 factor (ECF subfamily)